MKLLYVGDIMGELGIKVTTSILPSLIKDKKIDIVIAQGENLTDGKGLSIEDFKKLQSIGVDFVTGGNWTLFLPEIYEALKDEQQPIIRPANYPLGTAGLDYKYLKSEHGNILVISLLGKIVGKDSELNLDNPINKIDYILEKEKNVKKVATIVNFHGDYSSEKVVIGHYLDGRVSAVIGDHWHVPTSDARVLPNGTAHITDVGMCGSLDSSLGVKLDIIFDRWKQNKPSRNILEDSGSLQFNSVLVDIDQKFGLAKSIEQIRLIIN